MQLDAIDLKEFYTCPLGLVVRRLLGETIVNASGDVFKPIIVKGKGWAYAPAPIGKKAHLPIPNTPAAIGPIGGGLILFKIPYEGLNSRPLKLMIKGSDGKTGQITLDV